jgi:hypothetical protein
MQVEEVMHMSIEREHIHEEHMHEPVVSRRAAVVRSPFGFAQAICLAIGIFLAVIGAVGLARAGVRHLTTPTTTVGAFTMTPLLALVDLALGLVGLVGATGRTTARGVSMFVGPLMIVAGIVALIQPVRQLGWNDADGVVSIIIGAAAMIGALLTPNMAAYEERSVTTA